MSIGHSKLKLLSVNWISIFSNSDLDLSHRHLGSNPKLPLDISYPYSKFGVNSSQQTKVIERKPKVDARPPARPPADFSITITRFSLKTWLINVRKVTMTGRLSMQHFTKFQHFKLSKIYFSTGSLCQSEFYVYRMVQLSISRADMTQHETGSPGAPAAPAELTYRQSALMPWSSWFTHRLPEYLIIIWKTYRSIIILLTNYRTRCW